MKYFCFKIRINFISAVATLALISCLATGAFFTVYTAMDADELAECKVFIEQAEFNAAHRALNVSAPRIVENAKVYKNFCEAFCSAFGSTLGHYE